MEIQGAFVDLVDRAVVYKGPSIIQIRQLVTWTTEDKVPELPLRFTLAIPQHRDAHLVMTSVRILERLGPDENPDYKITGECEQSILPVLSSNSNNQRIAQIVVEYNPKSEAGKPISMIIQPK